MNKKISLCLILLFTLSACSYDDITDFDYYANQLRETCNLEPISDRNIEIREEVSSKHDGSDQLSKPADVDTNIEQVSEATAHFESEEVVKKQQIKRPTPKEHLNFSEFSGKILRFETGDLSLNDYDYDQAGFMKIVQERKKKSQIASQEKSKWWGNAEKISIVSGLASIALVVGGGYVGERSIVALGAAGLAGSTIGTGVSHYKHSAIKKKSIEEQEHNEKIEKILEGK